ncbi:MAG: DUF4340 domain-containing protein [Polyangiales bacterium]
MQWRKNRVAIGALVLAAMIGLTIWAIGNRDALPAESAIEIPTMEIEKDGLTSLAITRPAENGHEVVVLAVVGGEWRVTEPLGASADANNVQSALNRLSGLTLVGVAATNSENYPRLEVDDAQAVTVVATMKEEGGAPVTIRIGKYANGVSMVRIDDRPEVFTVKGSLRFPFDRDLDNWRDRAVTQMVAADVARVTFDSPKGRFSFRREDGAWAPAEKQRPIKDFDPKQVEALVSTIASLTATGFAAPDVSAARAGLSEPKASVTLEVARPQEEAKDDPQPPETVELAIGEETNRNSESYLGRAGDPTIFVISQHLADRLQPEASAFEKPPAPEPQPGVVPQANPQAQDQLPPEIMQQLQEQIRQQQLQQQR